METAKWLNEINEYVFAGLLREASAVEAKSGRKNLSLAVGSPDILPSRKYIEALERFYKDPLAHLYPGYGAIAEFSAGIIAWHAARFSTKLETQNVFPTNGGKDAIVHLSMALLDRGDEVLLPDPGYPAFSGAAALCGAVAVPYPLLAENSFLPKIEILEKLVTSKTKSIWVNFPSNPTGAVADLPLLQELVAFAKKHSIWLLYDNAYSEISFEGFVAPSILQVEGAIDIAVEVHSFSKSFSFAGYRMGWVAGNAQVIAALAKVKSQVDSGMSWPLQKFGALALSDTDMDWLKTMRVNYSFRQMIIGEYLAKLGLEFMIPKGSLYIWAKIPTEILAKTKGGTSADYARKLLQTKQILVTPGTAFGAQGEGYIRASICTDISNISEYFK